MKRHNHHCSECVFLGSETYSENAVLRQTDYYVCLAKPKAVLARHSCIVGDYTAHRTKNLSPHDADTLTAAVLALKAGLLALRDIEFPWIEKEEEDA